MMLVQTTTWLQGGSSRRGHPGRGLGRFDEYFEDFQATPLDSPSRNHGTHDPVWLTNTDNVLVSEGAGAGLQARPSRSDTWQASRQASEPSPKTAKGDTTALRKVSAFCVHIGCILREHGPHVGSSVLVEC